MSPQGVPTAPAVASDRVTWKTTVVQRRRAAYGEAGSGRPVVFLHGWGLTQHAYKRALRRVAMRGCHVFAPDLPGFGGTAQLPRGQRSVRDYAGWVAAFAGTVGIDAPAIVVGHSFGGGVAIGVAHDHPDLVSQLVLLNSVGGAAGMSSGVAGLPLRNPVHWGRLVAGEMLPFDKMIRTGAAMRDDFLGNVFRNPLGVVEIALLARNADLLQELEELRRRALPVVVVSGTDDGIVPMAAFEAVCGALGTSGTVLKGNHSWLLADPDAFGEVLANAIEPEEGPVASPNDLRDLLVPTTVPRKLADTLVDGAPTLWLSSDTAANLASDLVLCHPRLHPDEVRARVTPQAAGWRLTVVAHDRRGLLADTAGVLLDEGFSVASASVATWDTLDLALHSLSVRGPQPSTAVLDRIGTALRTAAVTPSADRRFRPVGRISVTRSGEVNGDSILLMSGADQPGLLWSACRWLADHEVSIQAAWMSGEGVVRDLLVVRGQIDVAAMSDALSRAGPSDLRSRIRRRAFR